MRVQLATHTVWRKGDTLCARTVDFFSELAGKAGMYVTVSKSGTMHTYALCRDVPLYTPYSDATRAQEDAAGESFETEHHELGPLTRLLIHEADELDRQRESAGLTYSEGEEA